MARLTRQNSLPLKEGFLVKKTRSWKSRWCSLHEDRLCYYGKTDRDEPLGCLTLYGASLVSPVPEYKNHKRKGVFKVVSEHGKEYLLQAPTEDEREVWIHAISGVIRALVSSERPDTRRVSRRLSCRVNLSDVLGAMQDPDAGIRETNPDVDGGQELVSFSGRNAVEWVLKWSFSSSRPQATLLLTELLSMGHIQMARVPGKKKSDVVPNIDTKVFHDTEDVQYKFSAMTKTPSLDMIFPDMSASSSSSEGEESDEEHLDSPKKGKIVKEGFLMKRGYYRRKWKLRKVVLRESPPAIEYYSASKGEDKHLLKYIPLVGVAVIDINDKKRDKHKDGSESKKKNLFCLQKDQGNMALVFHAEDVYKKSEWLDVLRMLCPESPGCVPYKDSDQ